MIATFLAHLQRAAPERYPPELPLGGHCRGNPGGVLRRRSLPSLNHCSVRS